MASKGKNSKVGLIIENRFKVAKNIGSGAFGEIYLAEDVGSGLKYAVKFESLSAKFLQLPTEYRMYLTMAGEVGFPRCVAYQKTDSDVVLVMDLLGKNLKELFEMCDKKFSVKTVLYIAIHTITRLEALHNNNYIYRDIKPENFMVGPPGTEAAKIVHIIDFGMVKEYRSPRDHQHIPFREGKPVIGTARYMSCNGHFLHELSRRDDLESLGYMFLFFLKGSLPWSGIIQHDIDNNPVKQCQKIGSLKQALRPEDLFEGFPEEFAKYLNYARNLQFEETPDYEALRSSFKSLFGKLELKDDGVFDWELRSNPTMDGTSDSAN